MRTRNFPRAYVVTGLGIGQILSWGTTYYLLAVLAGPIVATTGWPTTTVIAGVSVGLLVAGLGSPRVGTLVSQGRGRLVLVSSALLIAGGLAMLGLSTHPWLYLGAWVVMGLGMSGGLYNGAFAVLGHTYGASARSTITMLTLFGGFASTLCWPLSTFLVSEIGWRATAVLYAAIHVALTAPLYALVTPRPAEAEPASTAEPAEPAGTAEPAEPASTAEPASPATPPRLLPVLLMCVISTAVTSVVAVMSMHMFALLNGIGIAGPTAVALAATIGPSQVGARLIELLLGRRLHPLWTLLVATSAISVGLACLGLGVTATGVLIVIYGTGVGLNSIANGTVPLALFGQRYYARIVGRIAGPALSAQAASPVIGALLIEHLGSRATLLGLSAVALTAFALTVTLSTLRTARPRPFRRPRTW